MAPIFADFQKSPTSWARAYGVGALVLAALFAWFIMNSYPMMYPGYDIWWHLGVMQTGAAYDPSMVEYARWHRLWDKLLGYLEIRDIFDRALIIHRVQFLLTALAIGTASYLSLLAVFRRRQFGTMYIFASVLSVGIWLLMHGTHSSAHYGGEDSAATQSWIMWYSVNYQISLPLYFLATAGTLCVVSGALRLKEAWMVGVLTLAALAGLVYCHLAEFPYYLFALVLLAVVFGERKQKLLFLCGFLLCLLILLLVLPRISHRLPELPQLLMSGSYLELLQKVQERGDVIANGGGNRGDTSWNSLYTTSLIAFAVVLFAGWHASVRQFIEVRPVLFLMGTGLLPLALFNQYSAGVLALITNQDLAWRFSLASFLYLGVPALLVVVLIRLHEAKIGSFNFALAAVLIALTTIPFVSAVVRSNAESIVRSMTPASVHYGLSEKNRGALLAIAEKMNSDRASRTVCLDIFSTYYLYYILGQKNICLPSAISSLPGAADPSSFPGNCDCAFDRQFANFVARGLTPPAWDFRFKQAER
jgi:hypothetical protein